MFLKSIKLTNFRNYSQLDFRFNSNITILVGDNAQGKTNFLESIYFLSTTKSPKANEDPKLIKFGQSLTRVIGEASPDQTGENTVKLEIVMLTEDDRAYKKVKVNGVGRRIVDYIGNLSTVAFLPEDINLVTGPPSLRRWHIDLTLAQIDREYKKAITDYGEVIARKNRILKNIREGISKIDELDFWVNQQIEFGQLITSKRKEFFDSLNQTEKNFGKFYFSYLPNEINPEKVSLYQTKEIMSGASLIGPHRDDFKFLEKLSEDSTKDLEFFGSRGEQRTAVLDLKIAEVLFIEKVLGKRPILLLDDIFSELDLPHRQHVISLINMQQTIISTLQFDDYLKANLKDATIFLVENGQLSKIIGK